MVVSLALYQPICIPCVTECMILFYGVRKIPSQWGKCERALSDTLLNIAWNPLAFTPLIYVGYTVSVFSFIDCLYEVDFPKPYKN